MEGNIPRQFSHHRNSFFILVPLTRKGEIRALALIPTRTLCETEAQIIVSFFSFYEFCRDSLTDKAYFIAKEVSTTERTYLKDLEVITSVCSISPKALNYIIYLD